MQPFSSCNSVAKQPEMAVATCPRSPIDTSSSGRGRGGEEDFRDWNYRSFIAVSSCSTIC